MTTERIRELNDEFRTTFEGGMVVLTPMARFLPEQDKRELIEKVRTFADFNSDNDPDGEHDFGSVEIAGRHYFFKIDYYDVTATCASEDPADPEKTKRVMTIMRSDEY